METCCLRCKKNAINKSSYVGITKHNKLVAIPNCYLQQEEKLDILKIKTLVNF